MEAIKNKLSLHKAGNVLEVGTGTGKLIPTLLNIFNGIDQIIGVDMDPNSVLQAKNTYKQSKTRIYCYECRTIRLWR